MTPFDFLTTLSSDSEAFVKTLFNSSEGKITRITLRNLKLAEDEFVKERLDSLKIGASWRIHPKMFETLFYYYVGWLHTLACLTEELKAVDVLSEEDRGIWIKENKSLIKERVTARLDNTRSISIDNELRVLTVLFEGANKHIFKQVFTQSAFPHLTDYARVVVKAGQGDAWTSLFGRETSTVGDALAYLMLHAYEPQKYPLPS